MNEKNDCVRCSHSGLTLETILLQAVKKMDNWMKCQPKCQKCKQNVSLHVVLIKQSCHIG